MLKLARGERHARMKQGNATSLGECNEILWIQLRPYHTVWSALLAAGRWGPKPPLCVSSRQRQHRTNDKVHEGVTHEEATPGCNLTQTYCKHRKQ